jgi:hypothetical protein
MYAETALAAGEPDVLADAVIQLDRVPLCT